MAHPSTQRSTLVLALTLFLSACSSNSPEHPQQNPVTTVDAVVLAAEPADQAVCQSQISDIPWTSERFATAVVLAPGNDTAPRVEAVVYPLPDYEGNPWSQWGQGLVLDDGRFLSAVGDHIGPDGNSYVFEYDPATSRLTQIMDLLSFTDHAPGDWGFGKVHAQMVRGPCDSVLLSTYWGTRRGLEFTDRYQGDLLIRIDPAQRTSSATGVVYPEHGVPSLAGTPDGRLVYAEAVDPFGGGAGAFVVRDAADGATIFVDDDPAHTGFRAIAVDAAGRALYSIGNGALAMYDPQSNTRSLLDSKLPGEWLRAATTPASNGVTYGVTRHPEVFFALDADGTVTSLGDALGYTTSVALSADETSVYSVPAAHGRSWQLGAPLVALDVATGEQEIVVELQPLAEEQLGLRLGGTYNVAVDQERGTIYVGMNAGDARSQSAFGQVVLLIVTPP